jgi:phosphohistidine phosphatase
VRHAKSDWSDSSLADHDRPLATRGIEALERMRDHLRGSEPPDLVLCSSARRTLDTLDGIRAALPDGVEVRVEPELYGASASSLIDRLRAIDDGMSSVMLVGHNPGLHDVALELVGGVGEHGDRAEWKRLVSKFPTGAIATVSFDGPWAHVGPGCGDVEQVFTPRPPR